MNVKPQLTEKRLDLGAQVPLESPLVIYIEASSYCNLACTFCPQHLDSKKMNKQNMKFDTFQKVINDLHKFDDKLKMLRMCGTGDPLFNKELPKMLTYARENQHFEKFELITNGLLIDERKNLHSLTSNLTRLIISVEGLNDEDYLKFTNRKVKFVKLIEKVRQVYQNKRDCTIHIKIHNSAVKTDERKNFFYKTFSPFCDEIYIENLVDLWPETDSSYVESSDHRFLNKTIKPIKVCSQIFKTMQINADGSVIPCSIDWQAKNKLGNVHVTDLYNLWNGPELRDFRIKHLEGKRFDFLPCSECSFNESSDKDNIDGMSETILGKMRKSKDENLI